MSDGQTKFYDFPEAVPFSKKGKELDTLDGLLYVRQVYPKGPPPSIFFMTARGTTTDPSGGVLDVDWHIERYVDLNALSKELRDRVRDEVAAIAERMKQETK